VPDHLGAFSDRISIAAYLETPSVPALVAGMLVRVDDRLILRDSSGSLAVEPELAGEPPCWLALRFDGAGRPAVAYRREITGAGGSGDLIARHDLLAKRWQIHGALRSCFTARDFIEVDTPVVVENPGMEPYLRSWPVGSGWLRTSPEHHMKRLLAGGFDRIFQIGPCFRKGDHGSLHREEFQMLEWYRAFADLDAIAADIGALLGAIAPLSMTPGYFEAPIEVISCAEAFARYLGLELVDETDERPLREAAARHGIGVAEDDDWDTLFFRLFLAAIEPELGRDRPSIMTGYPARQAALAKRAPRVAGTMPTCYRFELFLRGIEVANAFYELVDPSEQRRRHREDQARREALGEPVYPLDEPFLAALASGLPPSAGIALGLDRLVALALGERALAEVLPFPDRTAAMR